MRYDMNKRNLKIDNMKLILLLTVLIFYIFVVLSIIFRWRLFIVFFEANLDLIFLFVFAFRVIVSVLLFFECKFIDLMSSLFDLTLKMINFLFQIVNFVNKVGVRNTILVGIVSLKILYGFISEMCYDIRYVFNLIQNYFLKRTILRI